MKEGMNQKLYDRNYYYDIVRSLTEEEILLLVDCLENKSCETCRNDYCRMETCERNGLVSFDSVFLDNCPSWRNDEIIGKSKVLKIRDVRKLMK